MKLFDRSFDALSQHMGNLLGPRPVAEIVITLYEDDRLNYQIEGLQGTPVSAMQTYKLLATVGGEVWKHLSQQDQQALSKEAPTA